MKNGDEAIERVLAGLQDVEAPEGMERRIVEAMRQGAPGRRGWRPMSLMIPSHLIGARVLTIAVAGVVVISLAAGWMASRDHRIRPERAEVKRQETPAHAPILETHATAAREVQPLPERSIAVLRSKRHVERDVPEERPVAGREMIAENHPAPEAPLTDEEKLLLRFAHRADPEEVAALSPVLQAREDAEEKAEVQNFFEPNPATNNE